MQQALDGRRLRLWLDFGGRRKRDDLLELAVDAEGGQCAAPHCEPCRSLDDQLRLGELPLAQPLRTIQPAR